ncbi:alpha/beta fold hydrolase [Streptomyces sp. 7N604]|uniref:alpha/beta fold hydrolase n=1 Tax=Streptomyces sp. 7N604 TaxID=3457415 RepID=UPI003FD62E36
MPDSHLPATTRRVQLRDATLHVHASGPHHAPPLVLLHGLASTSAWWYPVAHRLSTRYRVLRIDLRGHGLSDRTRPKRGYTIDALAQDIVAALDRLELPPVLLAGHSLGATIALRAAALTPHTVLGVACIDGGLFHPKAMFGRTWEQAATMMCRPRLDGITAPVLEKWLTGAQLAPAPARDQVLAAVLANYEPQPDGSGLRLRLDPKHEAELAHSQWHCDPATLLADLRCHVLAIAANTSDTRGDRVRRASLELAATTLGSRLHTTWLDGGHDLPLEKPDALAQALGEFAAQLARRRPRHPPRAATDQRADRPQPECTTTERTQPATSTPGGQRPRPRRRRTAQRRSPGQAGGEPPSFSSYCSAVTPCPETAGRRAGRRRQGSHRPETWRTLPPVHPCR